MLFLISVLRERERPFFLETSSSTFSNPSSPCPFCCPQERHRSQTAVPSAQPCGGPEPSGGGPSVVQQQTPASQRRSSWQRCLRLPHRAPQTTGEPSEHQHSQPRDRETPSWSRT